MMQCMNERHIRARHAAVTHAGRDVHQGCMTGCAMCGRAWTATTGVLSDLHPECTAQSCALRSWQGARHLPCTFDQHSMGTQVCNFSLAAIAASFLIHPSACTLSQPACLQRQARCNQGEHHCSMSSKGRAQLRQQQQKNLSHTHRSLCSARMQCQPAQSRALGE